MGDQWGGLLPSVFPLMVFANIICTKFKLFPPRFVLGLTVEELLILIPDFRLQQPQYFSHDEQDLISLFRNGYCVIDRIVFKWMGTANGQAG